MLKNQKSNPESYIPLQLNKEQRALFQAGIPIQALHQYNSKTGANPLSETTSQAPQTEYHNDGKPATPSVSAKRQSLFCNSILDNGQRLLVIVGKERRMIKLLWRPGLDQLYTAVGLT